MKSALKRFLTLVLVMAMFVSAAPARAITAAGETVPSAEADASALTAEPGGKETSEEAALETVPADAFPQTETGEAQEAEPAELSPDAAAPETENVQGDFSFRLLEDGTAEVTGCAAVSGSVSLPVTLGGAPVTAIAAGAFAEGLSEITIHGNVLRMEDGAVPAGTGIACRQGTYADEWARKNGRSVRSLTEGELYTGVEDMTDALGQMEFLSDSLVHLDEAAGRRLEVGDRFLLNHGDNNETFYTVTAWRKVGGKVYLSLLPADIQEIFRHREYEGKKRTTMTFSFGGETGVDLSGSSVSAASSTLAGHELTSSSPSQKIGSLTSPLGVSYTVKTTITSSFRVVVENGRVISGEMVTDQEDKHTITVGGDLYSENNKGKVKSVFSQKTWADWWKDLKEEKKNEKQGIPNTIPLIRSIGMELQIAPKVGWKVAGNGSWTWTTRTLCTYEYSKTWGKWALTDRQGLEGPDPYASGGIYGKAYAKLEVSLIIGWVTEEIKFAIEAGAKLELTATWEPEKCWEFSLTLYANLVIETGLWLDLRLFELQLVSAGSKELELIKEKVFSFHWSEKQGLHFNWNCAYDPMDYSIRYETGMDWTPGSRCYLKAGTYFFSPSEMTVCSFKLEDSGQMKQEEKLLSFKNILYNYDQHPEGLEWVMEQPRQGDEKLKWLVREPATASEYYWNEDLTVRKNLEAILGKPVTNGDSLPKKIVLEADWSDKVRVTYDARDGEFRGEGRTTNSLLTQFYAPGKPVRLPEEKPQRKLAEFIGWTTDPEGMHAFENGTEVTEDITVYAQYKSYDPTNHSTVNSIVGGTPTLIGGANAYHAAPLHVNILNGATVLDIAVTGHRTLLETILAAGCGAYESAGGQNITYPSVLGNVRGKLVDIDKYGSMAVSLTGLVDPSVTYEVFTVPSTINGLPVIAEDGLMQNLKAKIVVFSGTEGSVYVESSATEMFKGNTYVEKVYMDSTSIIKLGDGAFEGCTNLKEVSLPPSVTEIGKNAFKGCSALTKADFGTWVDTVGEYAFQDCTNLTEVRVNAPYPNTMEKAFSDTDDGLAPAHISLSLGRTVLNLPDHVFRKCYAVKSFSVAEDSQLQKIGASAFKYCTNLRQVTLQVPGGTSALVSIGNNAFTYTGVTEIEIPESMPSFPAAISTATEYLNHMFFHAPLKKITIGGAAGIRTISANMFVNEMGESTLEEIVLRKGVTAVGADAFKDRFPNLKKVALPSTLKTIGSSAFSGCSALTRIGPAPDQQDGLVLPEGVKTIGTRAFYGCGFSTADVSGSLETVSEGAFQTCRSLKSIILREGIRIIGKNAFSETRLQEVEFPASVKTVYTPGGSGTAYLDSVFYGTPLKKITLGGPQGITTVGQYMLINQSGSSTVEEIVLRQGVTEIGGSAFKGLTNLKKVTLPMTLRTIGVRAFEQCSCLTAAGPNPYTESGLVLPQGLTTLSSYAFAGCSGLTSAEIPGTVSTIWDHAFYSARGLTDVRMGEGVTSIGMNAFASTNIREIEIPVSVKSFLSPNDSSAVFYGTPLRKITIGGPNGITQIDHIFKSGTVSGTATLEEVILREGVTMICDYAFANQASLKSIVFPDTLTYIGDSAFSNCSNFVIYYRNRNYQAGSRAFAGAYNYRFVRLTDGDAVTVTFLDGMGADGEGTLTVSAEPGGLLEEPAEPFHEGWSFMGWSAGEGKELWNFAEDRVGIADLTLTAQWERESLNGRYRIEGDHAVLLSYTLEEGEGTAVTLPRKYRGYPVTHIADGAFAGQRIQVLTLPAEVEGITYRTFEGAEELYWIRTPSGCRNYITSSGWLYTAGFSKMVYAPPGKQWGSVTWGTSVKSIGAYALRGQKSLSRITFSGEGLTEIEEGAFMGCESLTAAALPDTVQRIGPAAFYGCEGLASVSGAANCVSIGDDAFAGTGNTVFYGEEDSALVRYAKQNGRAWNVYTVTYYLNGATAAEQRVQSGAEVPDPGLSAGDGRALRGWYQDAEFAEGTEWNFESGRMPRNDLNLYGKLIPLFDTEDYSAADGGETTVSGARIIGYNGGETAISVPETVEEKPVCALNVTAFPTGCTLHLPGDLKEIDAAAFAAAGITLYAPAGSETERLLQAAGYEAPAPVFELTFETSGGALIGARSVSAGGETVLPDAVKDGCTFTGWFADAACAEPAGLAGEIFRMPEKDQTLYAGWSGTAAVYPFLWKQEGDRIVVTGSKKRASVVIPETVNGLPVEEIAGSAFLEDGTLAVLSLPAGLKTIGAFAFRKSGLTRIELPDTVTDVGEFAFSDCALMTGAVWSANAAVPAGAFYGNQSLAKITLPEGIPEIGRSALEGCLSVTGLTLPDSVRTVGTAAFRNMSGLRKLTLGRNTAEIAATALDGCSRLDRIQAPAENTRYVSDAYGALYYADWIGIVRYPAGRTADSYTVRSEAILAEAHAFSDTARLRTVSLPAGLAQMGEGVFRRSGIEKMDLSGLTGLTALPAEAFFQCRRLSRITLGGGLTSIGSACFLECPELESLDIPDSVTGIAGSAFDPGTLLIGGAESCAERFAAENGLPFRIRGWAAVPAVSIEAKETLILQQGVGWQMPAQVLPENSTDELKWISADESLLRVDDGWLRPLRTGETELILHAGEAEKRVSVRITDSPIEFSAEREFFMPGQPAKLTARFVTDNYSDSVSWTISGQEGTKRTNGTLLLEKTGKFTVSAKAPLGERTGEQTYYVVTENGLMTIPSSLREIEEEAFSGNGGITAVRLPDRLSSMGGGAFGSCANLWFVFVPDGAEGLTASAFTGSPHVILVCREGSAAAAEAEQTGLEVYLLPAGGGD